MKWIYIIALSLIAHVGIGQGYDNAVGFRGGFSGGLTWKHALGNDAALELMLSSRVQYTGGYTVTALYEKHQMAFDTEGLNWYYGGGGHYGSYYVNEVGHPHYGTYTVIGLDAIFGLEYVIPEIPVTLSADIKPEFNIGRGFHVFGDGALSARFYF